MEHHAIGCQIHLRAHNRVQGSPGRLLRSASVVEGLLPPKTRWTVFGHLVPVCTEKAKQSGDPDRHVHTTRSMYYTAVLSV